MREVTDILTRVLVILKGGTIAMTDKHRLIENLLRLFGKRVPEGIVLTCAALESKDSKNVGIEDRVEIARLIQKEYENYDVFIVLHGTDTLAHSAATLSLIFKKSLQKPVFIIGASRKRNDETTEAKLQWQNTLYAAIKFHKEGIVGVYNVCLSRVLYGPRLTKINNDYDCFDSLGIKEIARVSSQEVSLYQVPRWVDRVWQEKGLRVHDSFEMNIETVVATDKDESPHRLYEMAALPEDQRPKGVIVVLNGKGTCSDEPWQDTEMSWLGGCKAASEAGIILVGQSQIEGTQLNFDDYDSTGTLKQYLLDGGGLTTAMMKALFRQALSHYAHLKNPQERKESVQTFLYKDFVLERIGDS